MGPNRSNDNELTWWEQLWEQWEQLFRTMAAQLGVNPTYPDVLRALDVLLQRAVARDDDHEQVFRLVRTRDAVRRMRDRSEQARRAATPN